MEGDLQQSTTTPADAPSASPATPAHLQALNQNTGLRLVEVAKLVLQDKNVPAFHRVPFYMSVVFALLILVLPLTFLAFSHPGYAFGSLALMVLLLLISLLGVFWVIAQYRPSAPSLPTPTPPPVFNQQDQHVQTQTNIAGNQTTVTANNGGQAINDLHLPPGVASAIGPNAKVEVHLPPPPAPNPLHQLRPPTRDFTGRTQLLNRLLANITSGANISGILQGMGGVGKTELALKIAHQLSDRYPDAQLLIELRGTADPNDPAKRPLSPAAALTQIIQNLDPTAKPPEDLATLQKTYLSLLHDKKAIILADNAASAEQVRPLLPPGNCLFLVTSRKSFAVGDLTPVHLECLEEPEAIDLLHKICPRIATQAADTARLCGRLPLALRSAASLLAVQPDLNVTDYLRDLTYEHNRLDAIGAEGVELSVEASLNLSYRQLSPETSRILPLLSVFPPGSFDAPAEEAVCQDPSHRHLSELLRYALVEFDSTQQRYHLHDLVRLFASRKLDDPAHAGDRQPAEQRHATHYATVLASADDLFLKGNEHILTGLSLFDREWPNIEAGQRWAAKHASGDDAAAHLASTYPNAGAYALSLRLHSRVWIQWLESVLAAARRLKDRRAEIAHLGNLVVAYADLGETRRAIEYHEENLAIAREIGNRQGEGSALGNLGSAHFRMGEASRAIGYYEQCLSIFFQVGDRRGESNALGNLGLAYAALGETRRAIEYYEQQLAIAREIGDRRGEGIACWNMALTHESLGQRDQAIPLAEHALAIFRQIEDPNVAKVERILAQWRAKG